MVGNRTSNYGKMNKMWHELPVLNLTPGFEPFGPSTAGEVTYIDYPSGVEPHVRIKAKDWPDGHSCKVLFTARPTNPTELMRVLLAPSALGEGSHVELFMPYMPHARQDRRAVASDAESLKTMEALLRTAGYYHVYVFDLHNPDSLNCRWNSPRSFVRNHPPTHFITGVVQAQESLYGDGMKALLVVPDKGMRKRLLHMVAFEADREDPTAFAELMIEHEQLVCVKERDPKTGKLKISIPTDVMVRDRLCVIVDDICDGGGTFIPVITELKARGAKRVVLAVSHGLFTKGYASLTEAGLDQVHCTNSWPMSLMSPLERVVEHSWQDLLGL